MRPEALEALTAALSITGNASSVHAEGRAARATLETAREEVRALAGAPVGGVVFTSGGTEAIHAGIRGLVNDGENSKKLTKIFVSSVEHAAVFSAAEATGLPVEKIPVDHHGVVDLDWLNKSLADYTAGGDLSDETVLVAVMLANNETGVIQPITEVADIVHSAGGLLLVDAVQAIGKIPLNFSMLGADLMAISAHKFGGPIGVGALITQPNLPIAPLMGGGGQEQNRRAGTHNVPAIAGFGKAALAARNDLRQIDRISKVRNSAERVVKNLGATVFGEGVDRLPGALCFSAPGFSSETQLMSLDLAGVAASAGSACSSGKSSPSHVLTAMGVDRDAARSSLRVSFGWSSTDDDAQAFCDAWSEAYTRIKSRAA